MCSLERSAVWHDRVRKVRSLLVNYLQLLRTQAEAILRNSGLVLHLVHVSIIPCSVKYSSWLLENRQTAIWLLSVQLDRDLEYSWFIGEGRSRVPRVQPQIKFMRRKRAIDFTGNFITEKLVSITCWFDGDS